jgi:hypothetical protein
MMQPRDILGVGIRAAGLVLLSFSFVDSYHVLAHVIGLHIDKLSFAEEIRATAFYLATGLATTRGAELIVRFAYGPKAGISN